MKEKHTLRFGFPSLVALLLCFLWATVAFWSFWEHQRVISARQTELAKLTVAVQEQTLRLFKLTEVSILAVATWIAAHPKTVPGQDPSFIKLESELRRLSDGVLDIRLVDSDGGVYPVPSASRHPVANIADRQDIRVQLNPLTRGLHIGDPVLSPVNNKWVIAVTYPIVKPGGALVIVAAVLELDRMARVFELQRDKPNGSITILKSSGVTLFRAPTVEGAVGKSLAKVPGFIEHLNAIDHGQYRVKSAFDGVDRLISHARLSDYPVIIAVTASVDDALVHWRDELFKVITLALFLTLTISLVTRHFLRMNKASRDRLAESEQRFHSLFEHAPEAILVFDPTTDQVIDANPQAEKVFQRVREDLLNSTLARLFTPVQPDSFAAAESIRQIVALPRDGESLATEGCIRTPTGIDTLVEVQLYGMLEGGRRLIRAGFIDITERKRADKTLRESEKHIRVLFNSGNDPILVYEADSSSGAPLGCFVEVNDMACFRLGYSREELLRMRPEDILAPEAASHPAPNVKLAYDRSAVYESVHLTRNGDAIPVEINAHLFELYDKALVFAMARDISERKQNERSLRLAASVFASTQEGIMITDADNRIIDVNTAFTNITGYARDEVLGRNPSLLKSGQQDREFYETMWRTITTQNHWQGDLWNRRQDGELYAQRMTVSVVKDDRGWVTHHVSVLADITTEKRQKELLEKTAHYDALTGIPNRVLLTDRMHQALAQTKRSGALLAVCYLDLDGFKAVNDTYGHEAGDRLLIEVAKRLHSCLRGGDTVARLGGDEFVLLLLGFDTAEECEVALQRVLDALNMPLLVCDQNVFISASVGASLFPTDDADSDTLLRHADQAMYQAKQDGKGRYCIFDLSALRPD